ncbi:MAG TPA: hypothetical protein VHB25_01825 [Gemmatimonadaceae bacterium]|nr:hypothetical protein [Gemmatimonadaceae bacterium]
MRRVHLALAASAVALLPQLALAQNQMGGMRMDQSKAVAGGGISVPGWQGTADRNAPITSAKFAPEGNGFHITTGPAATYWNPANTASGDYTVSATFTEPKYMNLNDHPHPYGIMIAGNDMGTPNASYLYCAAYGDGNFIVRGFGPRPFQMNGREGEASPAVHKAAAPGQPVTQDVAMSVKGNRVSCSINGKEVASYDKSALVTAGKLKSTDGVYGVRSAHNTEVIVSNLKLTKN